MSDGTPTRPVANHPYRVIVAKPGLDGHDRGARIVARSLRDAGLEVIYLGLFQTAESIANTARDEDVDAVGLSILSGAHNTLFPEVIDRLASVGRSDVLVFGGGVIAASDTAQLEALGVARLFGPGASLTDISDWLIEALNARSAPAVEATS